MSTDTPAYEVQSQPTPEASEAIKTFIETGEWPKPGTMPVRINIDTRGLNR